MSDDKKYNGWANYETWLCNLWFDDSFRPEAEECETINDLAELIKERVAEYIDDQVKEINGFVADLVNAAMSEIDWYEIAEHYEEDLKKKDEEETEEEEA